MSHLTIRPKEQDSEALILNSQIGASLSFSSKGFPEKEATALLPAPRAKFYWSIGRILAMMSVINHRIQYVGLPRTELYERKRST